MMTAPAIFFSLFAGAYSDRRGRRLLLALPFLGNILSYLGMAANLHWWEELPAEYLLISGQSETNFTSGDLTRGLQGLLD